jgi:hypothetical protein
MKRFFVAFVCLIVCAGVSVAQKGKAEPDYYPLGYSGDTWTGEVTAFDKQVPHFDVRIRVLPARKKP